MTNYDEMSLDELKELKLQREKAKLARELKAEEEATKAQELVERDTEVAQKAIQSYIDSLSTSEPDIAKETIKAKPTVEPFKQTFNRGGYEVCFTEEDIKDVKRMYKEFGIEEKEWEYGNAGSPESHMGGVNDFNFVDGSDAGCEDDLDTWDVTEHFCDLVWHAKECYGGLGKLCATVCDINEGHNARLDIRTITARANPQSVSACTCLSCVSNTFSKYYITLNQLGDYAILCSWDEFRVGSVYRRSVIKSMAQHWGVYFDQEIYDALEEATPGYTETLANTLDCNGVIEGSCCSNGSDIYGRLLDLDARMREAGYMPDYFIVSPTVANYFKYLQQPQSAVAMPNVGMEGNILTRIGHIKVVEYCGANACSSTTAEVFGILIDSSRAVGQAFGKKPTLEIDRVIECNAWKLVFWAYWGVSVLDTGAIGHIVSPNS